MSHEYVDADHIPDRLWRYQAGLQLSDSLLRTPPMDVHLGIQDGPESDAFFLYSCIAGTCVTVDFETALSKANCDTYITPGLHILQYHRYLNPSGGKTRCWLAENSPLKQVQDAVNAIDSLLKEHRAAALRANSWVNFLVCRNGEILQRVYWAGTIWEEMTDPTLFNIDVRITNMTSILASSAYTPYPALSRGAGLHSRLTLTRPRPISRRRTSASLRPQRNSTLITRWIRTSFRLLLSLVLVKGAREC
jgi:hypothetical protein